MGWLALCCPGSWAASIPEQYEVAAHRPSLSEAASPVRMLVFEQSVQFMSSSASRRSRS